MPGARRGLLVLCVLLASCARECGRLAHKVQTGLEIAGWICGGLFALVFLVGGTIALAKNLRAPSERSKRWGRGLGVANLLFGVLFLATAITHPPHDTITERVDDLVEVERVGPDGVSYIDTEIIGSDRAADGGINWLQMMPLLAFGIGWSSFGFASVWASRKPRA